MYFLLFQLCCPTLRISSIFVMESWHPYLVILCPTICYASVLHQLQYKLSIVRHVWHYIQKMSQTIDKKKYQELALEKTVCTSKVNLINMWCISRFQILVLLLLCQAPTCNFQSIDRLFEEVTIIGSYQSRVTYYYLVGRLNSLPQTLQLYLIVLYYTGFNLFELTCLVLFSINCKWILFWINDYLLFSIYICVLVLVGNRRTNTSYQQTNY